MKNMLTLLAAVAVVCVMTASTSYATDASYWCVCRGTETDWGLWKTYGNCGNGFRGGNKKDVVKNLTKSQLGSYIPPGVSAQLDTQIYAYYPDSGWACGKDLAIQKLINSGGLGDGSGAQ